MNKISIKLKYKLKELNEQIKEYKLSKEMAFKGELILDNYNKVEEHKKEMHIIMYVDCYIKS